MDVVGVRPSRVVCASGVAAFLLGGCGGGWSASADSIGPPTPADFVGYLSCMLYAGGSDLRLRVRAPRAAAVCRTLSRELARFGFRWSLHGRGPRRIVSPICLFADPRGQVEVEVIDDAGNSRRGGRICANLARDGWFDLGA
jgi:hypothetical protein